MTGKRQGSGRGFKPSGQGKGAKPDGSTNADEILNALTLVPEIDRRRFLRKQRLPLALYKFKSVNTEKPHILEDIIASSRLCLSSPQSFNDLFDLKPHATVEGDLPTLLAKIDSLPAPSQRAKQDAMKRAQAV